MKTTTGCIVLCFSFFGARVVAAQTADTTAFALDTLITTGERAYSAASSATIRALDIRLRPRNSSQQLLELAPGVVIAQHGGGGKAEQIFLRGFDVDHGTDVAISVDGVPVNVVSHAHGQGYADLHFLIPELVQRIEVRKGPFNARDGDFATGGALELTTLDRLPAAFATVRRGSFGTWHAVAGAPLSDAAYGAVAGLRSRGFHDVPLDHNRFNAFGKWATTRGATRYSLAASHFSADWNMSGQIPERAVRQGSITRFGSIDPSEGGNTARSELRARVERSSSGGTWSAQAFAVRYNFQLFSNFTFFLHDTINGDAIEQADDRLTTGLRLERTHTHSPYGKDALISVGGGVRADFATVELFRQQKRTRIAALRADDIMQANTFAWAQEEVAMTPKLRLRGGVRLDHLKSALRASPKLSLAYDVSDRTTGFAALGRGFHSNDVRSHHYALPTASAAELGMRHTRTRASFALAAWLLDLESELVYSGDEGTTEPSGRTRRIGIDAEARMELLPQLWADFDINLARGRFRDQPHAVIPLAPTVTSVGGLTLRDVGAFCGGVRYRYVANRAADETNEVTARGFTQVQAFANWSVGKTRFVLAVDNFFDTRWNEAQFATTSRLRGEREAVTELHFTPGSPRAVQLGIERSF